MVGNKIPDKNEAGNIKARHRRAICHQEARLKAPVGVLTASPGKNAYDKSTAMPVSINRTGRNLCSQYERRLIAPATTPPKPIPANTTASMIAKAVGDETTYNRRKRNQITSSATRMQPVPKLTKSKRHGG